MQTALQMKFVSSWVSETHQIPFMLVATKVFFLLPLSQIFSFQSSLLLIIAVSVVSGEAIPDAGYTKGGSRGYYDDGPIVIHLVHQVSAHPIYINHNPIHFNPPPIYHSPISYNPFHYAISYH